MRIALVTAIAAFALDEDLRPLQQALHAAGIEAPIVAWDDATVSWSRFDIALLRSPWDYTTRLAEFLDWAERTSTQTCLLNPLEVIRHNTDKHYLGELAAQGLSVVPSRYVEAIEPARGAVVGFHVAARHDRQALRRELAQVVLVGVVASRYVEPNDRASGGLDGFLAEFGGAAEFVVKPCVGAGSRDAQRYSRAQLLEARAHIERLQAQGRSVLLQPYLPSVDDAGETALVFFGGVFSHAIRKGPLLQRDQGPTRALFAPEKIAPRTPGGDELALAGRVLAALPGGPLPYARVDLIRGSDGAPCLLELELTEPSLFFPFSEGAAERFVAVLEKKWSEHISRRDLPA